MRKHTLSLGLALVVATPPATAQVAAQVTAKPASWIDAKTGHRILRLSDAPGNYALYFNYNAYTPQGDRMIFQTADGISVADTKSWTVKPLLRRPGLHLLFAGHTTRTAYFSEQGKGGADAPVTIYAADIDTGKVRKIADVPKGSRIDTINADETLLAGQIAARDMPLQPNAAGVDIRTGQTAYAANWPDGRPMTYADAKEFRLNQRLDARIPMEIFTVDVKTGARRSIVKSTDWLNHLQFSPTDPTLLMYCHEGPWHRVDRIWTVRTDGSQKTKVHTRTMNMEIAGHEFWSPDGKTIWYDLQTPRGEDFWLAGYDVATAKRRWYHLERNEWSVHYNVSADQTLFSGDGGDSEMVARAPDAKWLYLFRPRAVPDVAGIRADNADALIEPGTFATEKLVDMSRQDYKLEPNARFSPDGKWLIFRANIEGKAAIYAVETGKPAR
ncbi:oligogalacturonate lyase [Sphingomonas sp. Leaf17]|uniref:oligogalacturonate lyase family protein n=1 Tax=Sphingomonas sp. Leaf17 TaxID=1735683 RepID=UPI0006F4426F|nr:oligogalacturonate lyase family protein [Sphingomonas sp. Leaf17]KQM68151.1 oligogalacturonate lyase [Sphingomonas sp. Leaf17]